MAGRTGIEWCDATFNPWWGCARVSEACDHCYAATLAARLGLGALWDGERRFFGERHWAGPVAWSRRAEAAGRQGLVFCGSMCDVLEVLPVGHPQEGDLAAARHRLWDLIVTTPGLIWLLLTKRPQNADRVMPGDWLEGGWPGNAWFGVTMEDARQQAKREAHLRRVPAPVRFVSYEPALGALEWEALLRGPGAPTWVICGGESGAGARPMEPEWARAAREASAAAGAAFFFKQWGQWRPGDGGMVRVREPHGAGYDVLDGRTWKEWPPAAGR